MNWLKPKSGARVVTHLLIAGLLTCSHLSAPLAAEGASPTPAGISDRERGRAIIEAFAEVNRYWLTGPPSDVRSYSYVFNRTGGTQEFAVDHPGKTPRPRRQGVTYFTLLHQLALKPGGVTVSSLTEDAGTIRLALAFDPPARAACGNGIENTWRGYFSLRGDSGYLVLDAVRLVPLEAGMGKLTERFAQFVRVDSEHYVPLSITIEKEKTRFDWRFRLYEPGLWLFDDSHSGDRRVAWIEQVRVNEETPVLRQAMAESLAREQAETAGEQAVHAFLAPNQHWLLPSLEDRRGLVYEYRQESPYLEQVLFDTDGNVMVRLEASKNSPDQPTRQKLWLGDGRVITGNHSDRHAAAKPIPSPSESEGVNIQLDSTLDRQLQNLAQGLGWECALTRLAREPEAFWTETQPANDPGQYRLVLHPRRDVRLFAGTMLMFTSWAYMHDVGYDRSEILCDASTHRPLVERDFSGRDELKGEFFFEDWMEDPSGGAPGRVRAVIPHKKDGNDESLEVDARFRFWKPGVWILDEVRSQFRGAETGSTGVVTVLSGRAPAFAPITELLATARMTEDVLSALKSAPEGAVETVTPSEEWSALRLKAGWTDEARESANGQRKQSEQNALIGVHRARLERPGDGAKQLILDGVSTASWQEFDTEWTVRWHDRSDRLLGTTKTNLVIRAESGPSPFMVALAAPSSGRGNMPVRISVEGTVQRMTGAYHGHGRWFRFSLKD